MNHVQLFLSAVTAEFGSYRDALRPKLTRANVSVAVQDDFIASGTDTLDKLDSYVRACDAVIHLVGDMTGALAMPSSVASLQARYPDLGERLPPLVPFLAAGAPLLSYTQWEAYLAVYHGRVLIIAAPEANAPRDARHVPDAQQQAAQQQHLQRLRALGRHVEIRFASADKLTIEVLRSSLHDILAKAGPAAKPMNLPYASLATLFKGRESVLDQVRDSLQGAGSHPTAIAGRALHGLGGVGKTRLAVEYAWRHAGDYNALLFITADSPEALQRNFAALCGAAFLDLPEQNTAEESVRVASVLQWLRAHAGWLLILDNIDTNAAADAAERLLATLTGGHVLLTGRLSNWSGAVRAIELNTLAMDAARDFLLERTASRRRKAADDAAQARALAGELGQLALALEQASAYIAQRRLSFAAYLTEWQNQREKVLAWFDERLMQYPRSVAITWQTSVDQLSAPALRLLQRLAWFAPEPIPESLLDVAVPAAIDEGGARDALAELETYSLVTRAADQPVFSMHRLVLAVTQLGLKGDTRIRTITDTLRWVDVAFVGDPDDVRNWRVLDALMPHARIATQHADDAGIVEPTARLLNHLGALLLAKALHADAEPQLRRALTICEASYVPDHPTVAIALNNLATLLSATNRRSEAEPLYRRALEIDERSYGPNHPTVAIRLNNLASLLSATNRLAEAEPLYRKALKIDEASYGLDHPHVARDLNNLALLLQSTNCLVDAEPLHRRALKIDEARYGSEHPHVARDLNNLASLLQLTNCLAEAEPLYRRALKINEASCGPDHPHVARNLSNLACLLYSTNRVAEAEPLYRRALEIDETSYGPDHPDVATDLNNLVGLLRATDRVAEAEPLCRRALKIDATSYGSDHPKVARDMGQLAGLLASTNRVAEAESLYRRALKINEASFGPEHPLVAEVLNNLAFLLHSTNCLAEAELLHRRALKIDEASYGSEHPDVARDLNNLASLLESTNRAADAEPLYRSCFAILMNSTRANGHRHTRLQLVQQNYVRCLEKMGKSEAEIAATLMSLQQV